MNNQPIGVFDSGVGGTSILKELVKLLPNEQFIYLADSANAPYGEKSQEEIVHFCKKNTDWLLKKGCKLIVVACNTATTNAIGYLRSNYSIPFIGIEPAIKPAALKSKTHVIGVLATKGTLSSSLFIQNSEKFASSTKIVEVVGKGLVEYIEAGDFNSKGLKTLLSSFIAPLISQKIDYLVLGCSHYPYLIPLLKPMLPNNVTVIDSGEAVARQTKEVLLKRNILSNNYNSLQICFYTNSYKTSLKSLTKIHFNSSKVYFVDEF